MVKPNGRQTRPNIDHDSPARKAASPASLKISASGTKKNTTRNTTGSAQSSSMVMLRGARTADVGWAAGTAGGVLTGGLPQHRLIPGLDPLLAFLGDQGRIERGG